jgi:hypothetical protein
MNFIKIIIPATGVAAALILAANPAFADHHGGGHGGSGHNSGAHNSGAQNEGGHNSGGHSASAPREASRSSTPRMATARAASPRMTTERVTAPRAAATAPRTGFGPRANMVNPRGASPGRVSSRMVVGPRVVVGGRVGIGGPFRIASPYYAFRPRLSLGFGLWAGYPVAYPYYAGYPYPYADPYPYPYAGANVSPYPDPSSTPYPAQSDGYPAQSYSSAAPNSSPSYSSPGYLSSGSPSSGYPAPAPALAPESSVGLQSGQTAIGGVSFEISPTTAQVYVDGVAAGTVADFGSSSQPLGLAPGRHHIEVRAPGYQTIAFDSDVKAGEVTPYQGTLQPAQP